MNLRDWIIVSIIGILVIFHIYNYQPKSIYKDKIILQENKLKQDSLELVIRHLNTSIDSLSILKKKVVYKQKLIIKNNYEKDSIILITPDSNIIKLFSDLSNKLNSK